nr:MAG TPA: hypothetical protein [Caudoviricetes sp.]
MVFETKIYTFHHTAIYSRLYSSNLRQQVASMRIMKGGIHFLERI